MRVLLEQARNRRTDLGADRPPVGQAIQRNAEPDFTAGGDRVVETHALDEAPVARIARIGGDDVEEWPPLGAAASQTYHDHGKSPKMKPREIDRCVVIHHPGQAPSARHALQRIQIPQLQVPGLRKASHFIVLCGLRQPCSRNDLALFNPLPAAHRR